MKRIVYLILGCICAVLGVAGIILPIMPGVIFFVPATFFFSRSSEKLHRAVYRIPYVGKSVRRWEEQRVLSLSNKLGILFLFLMMAVYPYFLYKNKAYAIIMTTIFCISLFVILAIRTEKISA